MPMTRVNRQHIAGAILNIERDGQCVVAVVEGDYWATETPTLLVFTRYMSVDELKQRETRISEMQAAFDRRFADV